MTSFSLFSLLAYGALLLYGFVTKNRFFLIFLGTILGLHTLSSSALFPWFAKHGRAVEFAFWYAQLVTFVYVVRLGRARSPNVFYRVLVSLPASAFVAATFLALPWAIAVGLGFEPWAPWLPFAIAGFGLLQSLSTRTEHRRILLDGQNKGPLARDSGNLRRIWPRRKKGRDEPTLKLVQISDPHLGPFMSKERLRRICQRAVDDAPDLILLTGDFLTVESQWSPAPLSYALEPLRALPGRVFACMGNHDHECPELVFTALKHAGVEMLIDRAVLVETPAGSVQIVGADHHWRDRERALPALAKTYPRVSGALRLWLLHDPGGFRHVPEGEADLVLSGHTHGGHLGLLSLGLAHTIVSAATSMPDHGLWARGPDRLYVHRGTGHYGFPLRIGVPAEESLLEVVRVDASAAGAATSQG
jgi:predicted MPP superfamily phosphohydrolase